MATKSTKRSDDLAEIMKTMIIVQLGLAGVPQLSIRHIVGGDIKRVNTILKHIKRKAQKEKG